MSLAGTNFSLILTMLDIELTLWFNLLHLGHGLYMKHPAILTVKGMSFKTKFLLAQELVLIYLTFL
jgi:hypothetical protein